MAELLSVNITSKYYPYLLFHQLLTIIKTGTDNNL